MKQEVIPASEACRESDLDITAVRFRTSQNDSGADADFNWLKCYV